MNLYIRMVNEVIDYIEKNINQTLTLQGIAEKFYVSEFHFSRLFKIITGINLKQYILGRKLTVASQSLKTQDNTVTGVALDYGFEYPEVFSRAFKKQFGISPSLYKNGSYTIEEITKAEVVERNISNIKGTFTIKENYIYLDGFHLEGVFIEVNERSSDFDTNLDTTGSNFLNTYLDYFEDKNLYSVVNCHEDDSGEYTVFFGAKLSPDNHIGKLDSRIIPAGWYACFKYYGNMLDMRTTFVDDFYRWIMIKEIELCANGIGMINQYDRQDVNNVQILIPVKKPK